MTTPNTPQSHDPAEPGSTPQQGGQNEQPGFAAPGGAQPQYGQYGQPQQPQYGQQVPQYGQYGQPQQPQYGQQVPQYGQYGQPQQPQQPQFRGQNAQFGNSPYNQAPQFSGYQIPAKPGIIPLRPLTMGDLFEGAFAAMRRAPKVLVGLVGAVVAIATLTAGLVGYLIAPLINNSQWAIDFNSDLDSLFTESGVEAVDFGSFGSLSISFLLSLASSLAATIATGLVVVAIGQLVINRPVESGAVWEKVRPRIWALIGVSVLPSIILYVVLGVILVVGILLMSVSDALGVLVLVAAVIAMVVGTLLVMVRLMFAPSALILEERKMWDAIKRSWRLSKGSFWRIFGIYLLTSIALNVIVSLISGVLGVVVGLVFGTNYDSSLGSLTGLMIVQIITGTLLASYLSAVMTLLYIDVRIRREALDIELTNAANTPVSPRS